MKTKIVRIGNSQGIRLPRSLLDLAGFATDAEVDVEARAGELVVRPLHGVRGGWAAAFARLPSAGDDTLLDPPVATAFDESEWQWQSRALRGALTCISSRWIPAWGAKCGRRARAWSCRRMK